MSQAHKQTIPFPQPPLSASHPANAVQAGEDLVITLLDGEKVSGTLQSFDMTQGVAGIQVEGHSEVRFIPLARTKILHLPRMRRRVSASLPGNDDGPAIEHPASTQDFEIRFKDGDSLGGDTLSYRDTRHGLYLFPVHGGDNYICTFVSHDAIARWRIGPRIGEMLVEQQLVSEDSLDEVISAQEKSREQPIGEYLRSKAVVTTMELEQALDHQKVSPTIKLGEILVSEKLISTEQLHAALDDQQQDRRRPLGEILVDRGLVTTGDIQRSLAKKLGIPFVDLDKFAIDPLAVQQVPEELARQHQLVPLYSYDNRLVVTLENPMDWEALDALRFHTGLQIEPVMAPRDDIRRTLDLVYNSGGLSSLSLDDPALAAGGEIEESDSDSDEIDVSDNLVVKLVNKIIIDAHQQQASDIHVEPYPGRQQTVIRIRKDGALLHYYEVPPRLRNALVARIKVMAHLDVAERRKPQDGKIDFRRFSRLPIELRVATLPTANGQEDVVMRILASGKPRPLAELDLDARNLQVLQGLIERPHGLLFVCGPTGSGKTTTLHSILGRLNTPDRKIWTAEDPVEITQPGLRQVQVNSKIGYDFATAMRAFLRADPDVIMVGEMRDQETTAIGIEASLTGHLVLSTLHTNSAAESVQRLLNMGMDPFNFADALLGVLSQRLARRLCPDCREAYTPEEAELAELLGEYRYETAATDDDAALLQSWRDTHGDADGRLTLYRAVGCDTCNHTGYHGRIGLHEILVASDLIRQQIIGHEPAADLLATALAEGMTTLKQDGIRKVLQGHTDIHQVRRVCA